MENRHRDLLTFCADLNFGVVDIGQGERQLRCRLDDEILMLCRCLPRSVQTDALLVFARYFHAPMVPAFAFFKNYYAPSWSILHWLVQSHSADSHLTPGVHDAAVTAHAMALLLHPLDDHLNDGQLPPSHLALLLRSQAWLIMTTALNRLTDTCGEERTVRRFFDIYYGSLCNAEIAESLDGYCHFFQRQMATWLLVPVLITGKIGATERFTRDMQGAYRSFGIAWRLLDDIQDIRTDMATGAHSAIYASLPGDKKKWWDAHRGEQGGPSPSAVAMILDWILENRLIHRISKRICRELTSAAELAETCAMTRLADEFISLLKPLANVSPP